MIKEPIQRSEAITRIKAALKRRSGKAWSVTGGKGTAWGWIHIDATPARRTWREREVLDPAAPTVPTYEPYDTGQPGCCISPADDAELAKLLGFSELKRGYYVIPASNDYYREWIDRAEGRTPMVCGVPYWD